jgi:hypothetical protein
VEKIRRKIMIKTIIVCFCLLFTTHAFGKSKEYYQQTLIHILTQCNSECQEKVFKQEVHSAFVGLLEAILNEIRFKLSMKEKEVIIEEL